MAFSRFHWIFELHWGVSDNKSIDEYRENLDHTREAICQMLELFRQYEIHVTWATVGFLFCKHKQELLNYISKFTPPDYDDERLSNYNLISSIGLNEVDDPYHYASTIIPLIKNCPNQEIATHTFSHFYCLEKGPDVEDFHNDLSLACSVANDNNIDLLSIVFPRNQYAQKHLEICFGNGIKAYRGNSFHWLYKPLPVQKQHLFRRMSRLADSYINISGYNSYFLPEHSGKQIYNVPASRFFRPYSQKFRHFEEQRLGRIKKEMSYAATQNKLYHLWWHPHNFGKFLSQNISNLKKVLDHYITLKNKFSFTSMNMHEVFLHKQIKNYE